MTPARLPRPHTGSLYNDTELRLINVLIDAYSNPNCEHEWEASYYFEGGVWESPGTFRRLDGRTIAFTHCDSCGARREVLDGDLNTAKYHAPFMYWIYRGFDCATVFQPRDQSWHGDAGPHKDNSPWPNIDTETEPNWIHARLAIESNIDRFLDYWDRGKLYVQRPPKTQTEGLSYAKTHPRNPCYT